MLSGLDTSDGFRFLSSFFTPLLLVYLSVSMEVYCLLRTLDLLLRSDIIVPSSLRYATPPFEAFYVGVECNCLAVFYDV